MSKSLVFEARSRAPIPATELFAWHAREGALARLTPPWERMELLERTGDGIHTGARVVMRMRMGPIPRRWVAEHTAYVEGSLFQDTQVSGPFSKWVHTHRMWPEPATHSSILEDEIEYALPMGPPGRLLGGGFARHTLERMFAYRHRVTLTDARRHAAFADQGPLRVAVTGASGLIGSALLPLLTTGGHQVQRLVRGRADASRHEVAWAPDKGQVDTDALEGVDAVVHLAGANVAGKRWSPEYKDAILKSRSEGTLTLAEALAKMKKKPRVLVCAAGSGIYGDRGDEPLTEESAPGTGFLADVCRVWEAATAPAEAAGIRVVHLRIGPVLDARDGALAKMLPAFLAGGGGPIGSGRQWMGWVSMEDILGLIHFSLFTPAARGPINAVAPGAVRQADFARTLGRVLRRPAFLPMPAAVIRTLFGQMGQEALLSGARVLPNAAERLGYAFLFPELEGALRFTLGRTTAGPEFRHG
ncbi:MULTISPECIES: TIGR01777 family oxidoreductase [unclassified Myxococcus]|uniref:TIGR01777 family oxidoreductase n=1 Tax=Myxococcus TaxID=32 RepID=UPI001CBD172E|nr:MULTISPECIES: TIGR01777 family oxidoreductase [unclassified Myxococcus]MBZ4399678.1 TIGR01777 family oxidoreductase [Myxococcus sp. AS-1-15]MBZ4409742.1 TIGR01777 family oxidoreductase [Myxococcus sp. XM-1-1-1]